MNDPVGSPSAPQDHSACCGADSGSASGARVLPKGYFEKENGSPALAGEAAPGGLFRNLLRGHDHSGHARGQHGHSHSLGTVHGFGPHSRPESGSPDSSAAAPRRPRSDHSCGHSHVPHTAAPGQGRAFAVAVSLNLAIVALQVVYGLLAHSTALLADAGHNLFDALGLALAWGAVFLSRRAPSARHTFGFGASSILASLANAALLLVACGAIGAESVSRFFHPEPVAGLPVFVVATIGLLANGFCAWLFWRGNRSDLNLRGAFLHMLSDAAVSGAVAASGLAIHFTGWLWLDPALSLVVVAVIVWGTWGLLSESVRLAMGAVPSRVDADGIERYLLSLPGVSGVHDLHIWGLSTTQCSLIVHLAMPAGHPGDAFLDGVSRSLLDHHGIEHATIQICVGSRPHPCPMAAHPA